jgi:hypothetical protein
MAKHANPGNQPPIRLRAVRRAARRIAAEAGMTDFDVDARLQHLLDEGLLDARTELQLCLTLAMHSTQKPSQQTRS